MILSALLALLSIAFGVASARAEPAVSLEGGSASSQNYVSKQGVLSIGTKDGDRSSFLSLYGLKRDYNGGGGFGEGGLTVGGYRPLSGGYFGWDLSHTSAAVTLPVMKAGIEPRWFVGSGEAGCALSAARYQDISTFTFRPSGTYFNPSGWRLDAGLTAVFAAETVPSAQARWSWPGDVVSPEFSAAAGRTIEDAATFVRFSQFGGGVSGRFWGARLSVFATTYRSETRTENGGLLRIEVPL